MPEVTDDKKLINESINVKTYLVGSGEEETKLKELIKENNISDTFIMLGQQENVTELIKQADIFVSTSDFEGLPTVLLESLHVGVPFVAPNVVGIKDIANNIAPKNSYILTDNNIDSLLIAIKEMKEKKYDNFKFDINSYNNECIESFYKLLDK